MSQRPLGTQNHPHPLVVVSTQGVPIQTEEPLLRAPSIQMGRVQMPVPRRGPSPAARMPGRGRPQTLASSHLYPAQGVHLLLLTSGRKETSRTQRATWLQFRSGEGPAGTTGASTGARLRNGCGRVQGNQVQFKNSCTGNC